jgi:hypothetical protein
MELQYEEKLFTHSRNDFMSCSSSISQIISESDYILERLKYLRNDIIRNQQIQIRETQEIEGLKLNIGDINQMITNRCKMQTSQTEKLKDAEMTCKIAYDSLAMTRREFEPRYLETRKREKELIDDLECIYSIQDRNSKHYINNIYLPNSIYKGCNPDLIATALGYVSHYISIIAGYLKVPLKYQITNRASRSYIHDMISLNVEGSRTFPLFSKGSETIRFEYAVYLLNKNIEQVFCILIYS